MHLASDPCCPHQGTSGHWHCSCRPMHPHLHLHLRLHHRKTCTVMLCLASTRDSPQLTAHSVRSACVCCVVHKRCPLSLRCDGCAGARPCSWAFAGPLLGFNVSSQPGHDCERHRGQRLLLLALLAPQRA